MKRKGSADRLEDAAIHGIVIRRDRGYEDYVAARSVYDGELVDVITVTALRRQGQGSPPNVVFSTDEVSPHIDGAARTMAAATGPVVSLSLLVRGRVITGHSCQEWR